MTRRPFIRANTFEKGTTPVLQPIFDAKFHYRSLLVKMPSVLYPISVFATKEVQVNRTDSLSVVFSGNVRRWTR